MQEESSFYGSAKLFAKVKASRKMNGMIIGRNQFLFVGLIIFLILGGASYFLFSGHKSVIHGTNSTTVEARLPAAPLLSEASSPGLTTTSAVLPRVQVKSGAPPTYQYNVKGQLQAIIYPDGSTYTYRYDPYGDKISETNGAGRTCSYIYDQNHHPLSVIDSEGHVLR